MFEKYFIKPQTVDRFRASWIGAEVEDYVGWLAEHGYGAKTVWRRVPLLVAFGEFASERGARVIGELPAQVDGFVAWRVAEHHDTARGSRPDRPMSKAPGDEREHHADCGSGSEQAGLREGETALGVQERCR